MRFTPPITVHFAAKSRKPITYHTMDEWRTHHPMIVVESQRMQKHWRAIEQLNHSPPEIYVRNEDYPETHTKVKCGAHKGTIVTVTARQTRNVEWFIDPQAYLTASGGKNWPKRRKTGLDRLYHHPTLPIQLTHGPVEDACFVPQLGGAPVYRHHWIWAWGDCMHHWCHEASQQFYSRDLWGRHRITAVATKREWALFGTPFEKWEWQWWSGNFFTWTPEEQMHHIIRHGKPRMLQGVAVIDIIDKI